MAKPITLNESNIESMLNEFKNYLLNYKMSDGRMTFTKSFEYTEENKVEVSVMFTPVAYLKMLSLLRHFDSEVAWHGTVERKPNNLFIITDIIVYPQEVTGATVNTDQEEYQKWVMKLDDDFFNNMHMQGHSHVNFCTTPSATDLNHQESIIRQLNGNSYYIFMIFNKRLEHNIKVYDYSTNTLYEDGDVQVGILGDGFDLDEFIAQSDSVVKKNSPNYASYASWNTHATADTKKKAATEDCKTTKRQSKKDKANKETSIYSDQMRYGGYYGSQGDIDYDQMIFGSRRT